MTVKTNGAEFKKFYSDPEWWLTQDASKDIEHTWWDDGVILINGEDAHDPENCQDTDLVELVNGVVLGTVVGRTEPSLEGYFRRWKKAQNEIIFLVSCPRNKEKEVCDAIRAAGGKINK